MYTKIGMSAIALSLLATPAMAFDNCKVKGLDKMKSQEQTEHVFFARNSNKGKGNGGESIDIELDVTDPNNHVVTVTGCVATADEETGGNVTVVFDDTPIGVLPGVLDENDPGKGNNK